MSEKLQKVLARAGLGSRREMEKVISSGVVSVDGKIAALGDRVESNQTIRVDGNIVRVPSEEEQVCRVLMYHKPLGELCTRKDPEGRKTVFDRLPALKSGRWIAVGRLDINTSGMLLFTNDGELANRLMHPSFQVEREYAVRVFGEVAPSTLTKLRKGVELEDGPAKFLRVEKRGGEGLNHWYHVVLNEGRNREVRRLWESQEVQVSRLMRVRYGEIKLDKHLPQGGWVEQPLVAVNYLRQLVGLTAERKSFVSVKEGRNERRKRVAQIKRSVRKHRVREKSQSNTTKQS